MAKIKYRKSAGVVASAALIALLVAYGVDKPDETAQTLVTTVEEFEGYVPEAYQDIAGIWTRCFGDTSGVTPGATYSFDQCAKSLNDQLIKHSQPVFDCMPTLAKQNPKTIAAILSMTYNIGVGGMCRSSVAKYANTGQWEKACKRMAEIYKTAGGKPVGGLERRRKLESRMCLEGLQEGR